MIMQCCKKKHWVVLLKAIVFLLNRLIPDHTPSALRKRMWGQEEHRAWSPTWWSPSSSSAPAWSGPCPRWGTPLPLQAPTPWRCPSWSSAGSPCLDVRLHNLPAWGPHLKYLKTDNPNYQFLVSQCPGDSLCLCLCNCLLICTFFCFCICFCHSLYLSLSFFVFVFVFLFMCLCLCNCFGLSLCLSLSRSLSLSLSSSF